MRVDSDAGHVHVSCDGVARLVDRDRPGLGGDVLDVLRGPGLDGRHRLDEVLPGEPVAAGVVRVRERDRADLLDHRRRVAHRDARELVTARGLIELVLVRDPPEVEVEDVEPVLLRRRPEPDVAAHPARPRQRGVQHRDRHVARADEVDLLRRRRRGLHPQPDALDPRGDDVDGVEERVDELHRELARPPAGCRCRP